MHSSNVCARAALTAALTVACILQAWDATAQVTFRRIVLAGDPAPGAPPGAFFTQFGTFEGVGNDFPPVVDAAGNVAFHAVIDGPGIIGVDIFDGNGLGIWKHVAGVTSAIARQDDPAPGTASGVEFRGFTTGLVPEPPAIAAGLSLFAGALRGPGVDANSEINAHGLWRETASGLQLALRGADPAPGLPAGHTVRLIGVPFVSSGGRFMFDGLYAKPGDSPGALIGNQEAFWTDRSGATELLVFGGQQAPGLPAGVVFGAGNFTAIEGAFRSWGTNDGLGFAVNGNLMGPGIDALNDEGIWVEENGVLTLLVREGDPSPAVGPGVQFGINNGIDTFGELIPIEMNSGGALLFGARHRGGSIPFTRGIWTTRSGALELVAYGSIPTTGSAPGSPAPGMGPGATFSTIVLAELNDANQIAFSGVATIDMDFGNQPQGVWWDRPGALTLVARENGPAPGFPGIVFAGFNRSLSLDREGHLAFLAALRDAATGEGRGAVQILTDPAGGLHRVVWTGQVFDVAGDGSDLRVIAEILPGNLSPTGELPLELGFIDGSSGVFTARLDTPVGVPPIEPRATRVSLAAPEPNPRVGADPVTLRFTLEAPATVRLVLHDLGGRRVAERAPEAFRTAGAQLVRWNPGRLAPGVYFLRLELDSGASAVARCVMLD